MALSLVRLVQQAVMHLPIKGITDLLGGSSQKYLKMGNKISYAYKSKSNQKESARK